MADNDDDATEQHSHLSSLESIPVDQKEENDKKASKEDDKLNTSQDDTNALPHSHISSLESIPVDQKEENDKKASKEDDNSTTKQDGVTEQHSQHSSPESIPADQKEENDKKASKEDDNLTTSQYDATEQHSHLSSDESIPVDQKEENDKKASKEDDNLTTSQDDVIEKLESISIDQEEEIDKEDDNLATSQTSSCFSSLLSFLLWPLYVIVAICSWIWEVWVDKLNPMDKRAPNSYLPRIPFPKTVLFMQNPPKPPAAAAAPTKETTAADAASVAVPRVDWRCDLRKEYGEQSSSIKFYAKVLDVEVKKWEERRLEEISDVYGDEATVRKCDACGGERRNSSPAVMEPMGPAEEQVQEESNPSFPIVEHDYDLPD